MKTKLKGFTLVELIIVIVIIGILAAVTVIGYSSQTTNARNNSAFVSLSEAVKAANVCIANGDNLTDGTTALTISTIPGSDICVPDAAVSTKAVDGKWPLMTDIGGHWKYVDYQGTSRPKGRTSTANVVNGITTGNAVTIATANTGDTGTTIDNATDPGVMCTITGCTKYGF